MVTRIVDSELDQVSFGVDGSVQLWFGPNPLTAYGPMHIERGSRRLTLAQPGGRDLLCAALGSRVVDVELGERDLAISLTDGTVLTLALDQAPAEAEYAVELDDPDPARRLVWGATGTAGGA